MHLYFLLLDESVDRRDAPRRSDRHVVEDLWLFGRVKLIVFSVADIEDLRLHRIRTVSEMNRDYVNEA